jgi:hypothetical protein
MAMELACRPQRHDRLLAMPLSRDVAFRVRILSECRCVLKTTTSQVLGLLLLAQWTPVVACVLLGPLQSWLDAGLQLCRGSGPDSIELPVATTAPQRHLQLQ